jgi:serralysin
MTIKGTSGNDILTGTSQDDTFKGFGGADRIYGGFGSDTALYWDSPSGVTVFLNGQPGYGGSAEGDRLYGIEHLEGSAGNDTLVGSDVANTLRGGGGNDILKGYGGQDQLHGSAGDDVLTGGDWDDYLYGGPGNDTYVGGSVNLFEEGGQGIDEVVVSGNFVLPEGEDIEILRVSANAASSGFTLEGNSSGNEIIGSAGIDNIAGHGGHDYLTGGAMPDFFMFDFAPGPDNLTVITDFAPGQDIIDLYLDYFPGIDGANHYLTADEFAIGAAAQDASDRIIYNSANGALLYDQDGTGPVDAVHFATLPVDLNLTQGNFTIVW